MTTALLLTLNDTEVARANVAGNPPDFDTLANPGHEASGGSPDASPQAVGVFDLTSYVGLLKRSGNVLAIQGHHVRLSSTDFSLNPSLSQSVSVSGLESRSGPLTALGVAIGELVHQSINQIRQDHGLSPLGSDPELAGIAQSHRADMTEHDYFDHENAAGEDRIGRGVRQGYDCRKDYGIYYTYRIAENIFQGWLYSSITYQGATEHNNWSSTQEIAEGAVAGWMNNPGHRANILDDTYGLEGIGVAIADNDKVYVTQGFC